jgi:hypothetical protein
MNPVIQTLAAQPRLNFWLGPGCSEGLSGWSRAQALREIQRTNPGLDKQLTLEESLATMDRQAYGRFIHSSYSAMNWTLAGLAAIAAQDRAGAIVLRNMDGMLPRLLAARDIVPPMLTELDSASSGYGAGSLKLFELPLLREPDRWKESLVSTGAGNPWIVAGVDEPQPAELALLEAIVASGAAVYWVPLWNQSAPRAFAKNAASGFDPDSFVFALAQGMVGYAPESLGSTPVEAGKLKEKIQSALSSEAEDLRQTARLRYEQSGDALKDLKLLGDRAFRSRLDKFRLDRVRAQRLAPGTPSSGGTELYHDAKTVGGRRADELLAMAADEFNQTRGETTGFRASHQAAQWIEIQHDRAKLRRHADAQLFYEDAYRRLHSLPPNEPRQIQAALDISQMLGDWAATKDVAEGEALVREAIGLFGRVRAGGPLNPSEQRRLCTAQITLLRTHAGRLEPVPAAEFYQEARDGCEILRTLQDEFMCEYNLGLIAFETARKNRVSEAQLVAEGHRRFETALALNPDSSGLLHMDWGTALAGIAREREGVGSDAYFTEAFAHFAKAVADERAFVPSQSNWGAFLLVQARKKSGEERERLLSEAWPHASLAEEKDPTLAAYNLACIAAERHDWKAMTKWLRISARGPRFPSPSHTDMVTSFNPIRDESWFKDLLRELCP